MAYVRLPEYKKVCCAIDFGTWGTGFAFRDFLVPGTTRYSTWPLTDSPKTLTEALVGIQPPHKLKSFGCQARDDLTRMTQAERDQVMHFKQFKMQLAGEGDRNWMVKDNEYPDRTINFKLLTTRCIEYVCGVAMTQISAQFSTVTPEQIQWVLTVPAIWDQAARRLMLDAAEDAGLFGVMIALEPEGASLAIRADLLDLQVGTTYLIVDAGGGTVDITLHRCTSNTEICELYPPSGGPWGSASVNTGVISFLKDIFDPDGDVFPHAKKTEWYQLEDDIESLKLFARDTDGSTAPMNFDASVIYGALQTLGKPEFSTFVDSYNTSPTKSTPPIVVYRESSLRLPTCIFTNIIKQKALATSSHIITHILPEITETVKVFLVGGFSRSEIFRDIIKKELSPLPVSWPHFPITAVMQGAVEFGINPMSINKRCVPYTYAVLTSDLAVNHPGRLAFWTEQGEKRCHVLKTFVKSKDIINVEEVIRHTFCPMTPQQESVAFTIYKSKKREITYPEENGVIMVKGGLTLNNVPNRGRPVSEREVVVTLNFGSTVIAVDVAHGSPTSAPDAAAARPATSVKWIESISSVSEEQLHYHIVFCLDESGSMCGDPWREVSEAVDAFVKCRLQKCPTGDTTSVVTYNHAARQRHSGPLSSLVPGILGANSGGGTSFSVALSLCDRVLMATRAESCSGGRTPILLFMSDGQCDNGLQQMKDVHAHHKDSGLKIFVVGFGAGVNTAQLEALAAAVCGSYSVGKNGAELVNTFTHISSGLSSFLKHNC